MEIQGEFRFQWLQMDLQEYKFVLIRILGYYCMDYFKEVCLVAMGSSIRKPSMSATSVSTSIGGNETVGDVLRKAKKELILSRICYGLFLLVLVALIVYLFVAGYVGMLVDEFFALL